VSWEVQSGGFAGRSTSALGSRQETHRDCG
jgi:hypothetical protein